MSDHCLPFSGEGDENGFYSVYKEIGKFLINVNDDTPEQKE